MDVHGRWGQENAHRVNNSFPPYSPAMTTPAAPLRHPGIDRLKAWVTLLVVFHHTAITYGGPGGWFWRERSSNGSPTAEAFSIFCAVNQAWFMGMFFLIAGAYVPGALQRKGSAGFLRDRVVRLGIPLMVFGWLLGPVTVALAQTPRGAAFTDTLLWAWRSGRFFPGPLWFATALLAMSAVAALRHTLRPSALQSRPFPSNAVLLAAALGCGALAFALRLVWPVGTSVWGLQFGYFASYMILFAAGMAAAEQGWWLAVPPAAARTWRRVAWCTLPWLLLAFAPLPMGDPMGGVSPAAAVYAFWEPFVAWGIVLTLLVHAQARTAPLGRVGAALARRAFAIYVIHPPVLVAVALAGRELAWPALLKFALTGSLACALCYLLAGLLLRVPGVGRVL
jgi:fucose 4-O-acetylase-like acetyltransferase